MVIIVMNKKGLSPNRELEVEEEEEEKEKYNLNINLEERIIDNFVCIFFVLESIPLFTFLPS
jgi:hypothetical protein